MNRISLITESGTSNVRNKAKELKKLGKPIINFAAGELSFDTTNDIKYAAKQAIDAGLNQYTDTLGLKNLRDLISKKVSKETGVLYSLEEVGVTAGAKQALFNSMMVLFDKDDEVIIPTPCWGTFVAQTLLSNAKPIFLDTTAFNYQIDINLLEKTISNKTKGIILNTPNNPTGIIYNKSILEKISKFAIKYNFWIIFDECYSELVWFPNKHNNIVNICNEIKERTILINSFSKTYSITGWRLGYFCAPQSIVNSVKKLQGHTTSNPNSIAQYSMIKTLDLNNDSFINSTRDILKNRLSRILKIIDSFKYVTYVKPNGAFYIFLNFQNIFGSTYKRKKIKTITDVAEILLEELYVAITPGDSFLSPNCARISYSISDDEIDEGLRRINEFLNSLEFSETLE